MAAREQQPDPGPFASRAAAKLAAALDAFGVDPAGKVCADLGCSAGGFTDVLLRRGAVRVHAVDTGYGVLDWRLRGDARVVVRERTNALNLVLPEPCDLVVIDVGWTRQARIVPAALALLAPRGEIITLLKPHYEAPQGWLRRGVLARERLDDVVLAVIAQLEGRTGAADPTGVEGVAAATGATAAAGLACRVVGRLESPIAGAKGGNKEVLLHIKPGS
jgi:23S rRNA (cytidine1920-2'-O)/16S rRNA (cytidine1409-2'-O)-methyltransferase